MPFKVYFSIVLFAQPLFQSIYGLTLYHMKNWPHNWRFLYFYLNFTQILPLLRILESLRPTCVLQSTFLVLHYSRNRFSVHLWIYSVSNGKFKRKMAKILSKSLKNEWKRTNTTSHVTYPKQGITGVTIYG